MLSCWRRQGQSNSMPHSVNLELRILGETIYRKRSEYNSVSLSLQAGGNQRMVLNDYYVYVYIDPRDFKPFYYGKGKGSRKDAHLFDRASNQKTGRIEEIRKEGLEPLIRVLARGLTEEQALVVEATLIWQFKDMITNRVNGSFIDKFRPQRTLHKEMVGFDYDHRLWYFNVGDGEHRRWDDNISYGYVGAGQKDIFRDAVEGMNPGDAIAAYLSGKGYVGVGKIVGPAKPAREFRLKDRTLLIDRPG